MPNTFLTKDEVCRDIVAQIHAYMAKNFAHLEPGSDEYNDTSVNLAMGSLGGLMVNW